MTIKEANAIDMVAYLSKLGFDPAKSIGNNCWYFSPFRNETEPSFKINRRRNQWYDFGEGRGGSLLDFILQYEKCSFAEALIRLEQGGPLPAHRTDDLPAGEPGIEIRSARAITSPALIQYCQLRRITMDIAGKHLRQVHYRNGGKAYYALGFKNDAGGYELRSPYFKGSSHPKSSTSIRNQAKVLAVFEGFFDFLSYLTILHHQPAPPRDFLVLNSTSFFEMRLPIMQAYRRVYLYLDNDRTGTKFTDMALQKNPKQFFDERRLYSGYKDLNDWHQHMGSFPKPVI